MSLCDAYERAEAGVRRLTPEVPLTPVAREAAQEALIARWLTLEPSRRNALLDAERDRQGVAIPDVPTYPLSRARTFTQDGVTRTIRQWAAATGWDEETIRNRIRRGRPLTRNPSAERWMV